MRIALISSNYLPHPGGLEVMVGALARGLARSHEVTVIAAAWGDATGVSREEGLTVHRLPAVHLSERFGVPYPTPFGPGVLEALPAIRAAEILHCQGALYASSAGAALVAAAMHKPLVLTEHVGFVHYRSKSINAVQRAAWSIVGDRVVRSAAAVAVYNARVLEWLRARFPAQRLEFIPNGVDVESFAPPSPEQKAQARRGLGLPADAPIAVVVARESEKKNLSWVLQMPRGAFQLAVCGWTRNMTAPGVSDLGVVPHPRMPAVFAAADVMIHAASGEGFPLAVQEAMASGLPVVLLWDHGYAASLDRAAVAACDSLEELAPALEWLWDPARRAELGARARRWAVDRWRWDATVCRYEALYRSLLGAA